ncbi:hypothetical protein EMCRGX_G031192 [Ephydatia muelleri]|eukprot:Em0018g808a
MDQAQISQIGQQFVQSYYQTFDTNRAALVQLYRPESQLYFEGSHILGAQAIVEKLMTLTFRTIQHAITTADSQLTVDGGLVVFVVGQLKTDEDQILGFSQTFYVKQFGNSLFVMNDLFRLSLHHQ